MNRIITRCNSYKVIGLEPSPYTNKVTSYLQYKNIEYESVMATMSIYAQVIMPKVGWPIIPVLATPDNEYIQDSEDIILSLEKTFPENSILPTTPKQQLAAQLLQLYGDQYMTLPVMHYRWSFAENYDPFIYYNFGVSVDPSASWRETIENGEMLANNFRKFCKPLGINDETAGEIENNYLALLGEMTEHLDLYPYLLGSRPCLGDFSLHGMIYAHLIRDARTGMITKSAAPLVNSWCEHMRGYVKEHPVLDVYNVDDNGNLFKPDVKREFLPNDEIPDTLMPLLKRVISDFVEPIVEPTVVQLNEYAAANPAGGKLPKPLIKRAPITVRIGKASTTRLANPFDVYRLQEAQRLIQTLDLDDFVNEIDPQGSIKRCRHETFTLQRVQNHLHMIPI